MSIYGRRRTGVYYGSLNCKASDWGLMELILLQLLQFLLSAALPAAIWAVLVWCITDFLAKTKKPDYSWLVLVTFHVLPLLIFASSLPRRCSCTSDDTRSTILLGEYRETRQVTVDAVPDTAGSSNEQGEESPSCMSLSNGDYENSPCEEEDDDNNDVVIDDSDDDRNNDDNLRNRSEEIIEKIKQQWQQEWQTEAEMHPP